ncbi:MAG TPA: hypothetical protein VN455_01630, partial [Methanotrichaceae archaeon]|nr:hypothetical protein [Methanotrichaceae archaeon]
MVNNKVASFIAGIVFAFNPYHLIHGMGHLGATTILWIPFSALYLIKCFKEPSTRNSVLAGIFFILVAMSDLQYMIFMGLFASLLFFYDLYLTLRHEAPRQGEALLNMFQKYAIFGLVASIGILPLTFNEILIATSKENFLRPDPSEAITFSTDLLSFFLPSILHPLFGGIVAPVSYGFTGNPSENTTFIGYTVLLLSLITIFKLRSDKTALFWIISAVFFSVMSLGPVLHLDGRIEFTRQQVMIPLPYSLIYHTVPFLENCRTVGRFFVIAILSFSVLSGYGISWIMRRYPNRSNLAAVLVAALIVFEYASVPYPLSYVDHPAFYENISHDKGSYALLEIPATKIYESGVRILYYQTIHCKPIVGTQAARVPSNARDFELNTPFIRDLTYLAPANDIAAQNLTEIGASVLNQYDIKYVIIHKDEAYLGLTEDEIQFADSLLRFALKVEPVNYDNGSLAVYEVPLVPMRPFMALGTGFYELENWSGMPARWMQPDAVILAYSPENHTVNLRLQAVSFYNPRTVEIYAGSRLMARAAVNSTSFVNVTAHVPLIKGENIIRLHVPEGYDIPGDMPELNNTDDRHLSLAVRNVTILP